MSKNNDRIILGSKPPRRKGASKKIKKKPVKLLVHKWPKIYFVFLYVFVWLPANKFKKNQFFDFRSCTKDGFFLKDPMISLL